MNTVVGSRRRFVIVSDLLRMCWTCAVRMPRRIVVSLLIWFSSVSLR
jgi:hypothetical protein